ncbi:MAG: YqaA family protein [Pseudobdellovibrionaceae bacterium]
MSQSRFHTKLQQIFSHLKTFAGRSWYAPFIGFLSFLDNLVIVIPNDGILISSTILKPKRWLLFAVCITIGSTLGALAVATLVRIHGLPWILSTFPNIEQSATWLMTESFFDRYGLFVVFVVAASPVFQQPSIILAALAHTPMLTLLAVVFAGRLLKFVLIAYIASHAPKLLSRMWGMKGELEEVGIDVDHLPKTKT